MAIRFCSIGSGSEGNALLVESDKSVVMLDCGFGLAEVTRRLERAGIAPTLLSAIVVTHEHADHLGGVARLARKHGIPVWMTHGTAKLLDDRDLPAEQLHFVDPHDSFEVGALLVTPFLVPHDAYEPVQYVFSDGAAKLGVLTDTGTITGHISQSLSGCDALVLECNHDLDMLMNGPYTVSLKKRVAGRFGHLDNLASAALLRNIDCTRLKHILAAHLSKTNNRPELAQQALAGALGCEPNWIGISRQDSGFDWRSI